jgi:ATP-binding cassette subfamily C protein
MDVLKTAWRSCRRSLIAVGLFSIAINVLMLTVPLYMIQVFDRVLSSGSVDTLIMLSVVALGALVLFGIFDLLRNMILARTGAQLESALGGPLLAASIINRTKGDRTEAQSLRDLAQLRAFLSGPVVVSMFDVPVIPFYVLVVFLIHPSLGAMMTAGAVVLFLLAIANQMVSKTPLDVQNRHAMAALSTAQSLVRNAEVIHAMSMFPQSVAAWGRENAQSVRAMITASNRSAFMQSLSKVFRLCLQIGLLGYGAWLVLQHELTAGMIFAATLVGARALAPVESAISGWQAFVQARAAHKRVQATLRTAGDFTPRAALPEPRGEIAAERLAYVPRPGAKPVLKGLSFRIAAGEMVGVVGPTGAGKSTLARLLVGAMPPTSGTVRLDGGDLANWDRDQLGAHVGYLPQDVELFPGSIADNIARLDPEASTDGVIEAAKLANVHDLIMRLPEGYETMIDPAGFELSGGQRQRIALARAFFGAPCFIVLDEPNASLDADGEYALMQALVAAKERGVTTIVIAHRPSLVEVVDRILVLREGGIEMYGPRADVLSKIRQAAPARRLTSQQQRSDSDQRGKS